MHRIFKRLLPEAVGRSEWIVVVNADIRGFSSRMSGDPAETALYLKKVYGTILDKYFSGASFFKPTGDGLLVVIPFVEGELEALSKSVIQDSLTLVAEFAGLVEDTLIRGPYPNAMGIGLSAGSSSRIVSGRTTLDYAGAPLNIATRLMDLARPSGVVVDTAALPKALPPELSRQFRSDHVYLKGVAETDPIEIRYTYRQTSIPDRVRKPIRADEWRTQSEQMTVAEVKRRSPRWRVRLQAEPTDRTKIAVTVRYPAYERGKPVKDITRVWPFKGFEYVIDGTRPIVRLDFQKIVDEVSGQGVSPRASVSIEIGYPVAPGA